MAAECCSSCEYQRTVGYPSTSWASCIFSVDMSEFVTCKFLAFISSAWHMLVADSGPLSVFKINK